MKAYQIKQFGIENLLPGEMEIPKPGPGEVLIRIHAASLNFRDVMIAEGTYNPRMRLPAVPFSDGAGEVVEIGPNVTRWTVGDRVSPIFAQGWIDGEPSLQKSRTALGAGSQWDGVLREYAVFNEEGLVGIPDHLSFEEASTLPCAALTAWNALAVSGGLKAGDTVLTLGTGGVSIFALQIAKLFGARVIITSSSDPKLQKARDLGADEVINYSSRADWDKAVLELTGKAGVDHVIEVGGNGTLARSVNSVRYGGHIALIGMLAAGGEFNPLNIFMRGIRVQGVFVGSRKMLEDLIRAFEANDARPVIDRVFGFDEVPEALRYMKSGSHFGKIVVRF